MYVRVIARQIVRFWDIVYSQYNKIGRSFTDKTITAVCPIPPCRFAKTSVCISVVISTAGSRVTGAEGGRGKHAWTLSKVTAVTWGWIWLRYRNSTNRRSIQRRCRTRIKAGTHYPCSRTGPWTRVSFWTPVLQVENNYDVINNSACRSRRPVFTGVQNDTRVHGPVREHG